MAAATELIDEALAVNPIHPLAQQLRAEILIDNEEYEKAIALTDEVTLSFDER